MGFHTWLPDGNEDLKKKKKKLKIVSFEDANNTLTRQTRNGSNTRERNRADMFTAHCKEKLDSE